MNAYDNGGFAFPRALPDMEVTPDEALAMIPKYAGMSLRDYFAAQFMERSQSLVEHGGGWDMDTAAQCAYAMADAMLKARQA